MLERNTACLGRNVQPRGGYGEGSYGKRGNKSCGKLRTKAEDTRDQVGPVKTKWVQEETQTQWIWIKEREGIIRKLNSKPE